MRLSWVAWDVGSVARLYPVDTSSTAQAPVVTNKNVPDALAGVAQWIACLTVNQRVTGSVPSQGTCLGCRPGPQ